MKARELMTARPVVMTPDDQVSAAAELMKYHNVGAIPVVADRQGRKLVGLVTARDITVRCVARHRGGDCSVRDTMTPGPLLTVGPEAEAAELAEAMRRANVRRVPVVTDGGAIVGIVSQVDLPAPLRRGTPQGTASTETLRKSDDSRSP